MLWPLRPSEVEEDPGDDVLALARTVDQGARDAIRVALAIAASDVPADEKELARIATALTDVEKCSDLDIRIVVRLSTDLAGMLEPAQLAGVSDARRIRSSISRLAPAVTRLLRVWDDANTAQEDSGKAEASQPSTDGRGSA
ncbi:hypothetical protein MHZ93_19900 [Roseomonas sp. ACRSG]|nr:hypothetical protein [Roseomonas sp. ACRSG]